jgi:predicted RNase H-like HicB family nuclease
MSQTLADTLDLPILQPQARTYHVLQKSTDSEQVTYRVIMEQDEDGRFVVTCPDLQGVVTDGATQEEAMANVRHAINDMLEALKMPNKEFNLIPIITL